jgi:hypothetical protein
MVPLPPNAVHPTTRAARIAKTARLANENQRANQWRGPQKAT